MQENSEVISLEPGTAKSLLDKGEMQLVSSPQSEFDTDQEQKRLLERAQEIFEEDFFGPQEISKLLNFEIDTDNLPKIRFSEAELQRAKKLGQKLILRVGETKDGIPLTMHTLDLYMESTVNLYNMGNTIHILDPSVSWYLQEPFFTQDTPRSRWALVSPDILPSTTYKNYIDQTQALADYVTDEVFTGEGQSLPKEYEDAIKEFEHLKVELNTLMYSGSEVKEKEASQILCALKLTQLTRATPVDTLYDILVHFQHTKGERVPSDLQAMTSVCSLDDLIVCIGAFRTNGLGMGRTSPNMCVTFTGTFFSR